MIKINTSHGPFMLNCTEPSSTKASGTSARGSDSKWGDARLKQTLNVKYQGQDTIKIVIHSSKFSNMIF